MRGARFGAGNDDWVKLTATSATLPDDAEFRALEEFMKTGTGTGLIRVPVYSAVIYAHGDGDSVDSIYVPRSAAPQFNPNNSRTARDNVNAAKRIIKKTNDLIGQFIALQKPE
jgi:hypothetical protein